MSNKENYTSDESDEHSFERPKRPPPVVSFTPKDFAACRLIKAETLRPLLDLPEEEFNAKYVLIDCRYPYEYEGGHIKFAQNFHDHSTINELFFPTENEKYEEINKKIPIFYCEFSQVRGPKMAQTLRQLDRERNGERYPLIDYEEMYVLERGYNNFYRTFKKQGVCVPDFYTPMNTKKHTHHLKQFTFHRARSQASFKPLTQGSRAGIRRKNNRLQSTQSCMFGADLPSPAPPSPKTSTPKKDAGPAPSLLDQELKKWREKNRITSVASTSEWDSTVEGSFFDTPPSHKTSSSTKASMEITEEVHSESTPNSSFCKPVQLSFSCE